MVNFNGNLLSKNTSYLNHQNRGLRYGDALFESIRVVNGKIFFWEDHYLRLMASMRILRMEIPMDFTMEFLEEQLLACVEANGLLDKPARLRFTVFRNNGGLYLPETNDVSYIIEASLMDSPFYTLDNSAYEVELFKDFYVNPDMLSTLKTNNKVINVVGSIFAAENGYQNCLLLNNEKKVVEALNGNLFLVKDHTIKTPSLKDGCLNGIVRKKLIAILGALDKYHFEESFISPFELQKADELFITNAIIGIQPITKYRKKEYETTVAADLLGKLNATARLDQ
ncbi:aminotransferase class IV [Arenibacter sp. M-2]|uniref:aminotransferase class IV n=1 Tax=unclassified Arenibacter TaxID=2615047 RepID=UPI000D754271|nr:MULTISPECIES: aminotransferase class IV [unclassified Arenibacter]MDL5511960.1 aminotransferase class IV [Arenibacter sp. M-2]PXX25662.1 branched-chain amino acid aminotransferase [Arenibacter sp. ARW7G5Y1]|tara:strand:- start:532 stop:1380 length:849 start_codon:yes stop_codon:yes gene_type:complete